MKKSFLLKNYNFSCSNYTFALLFSVINLILYHSPLFKFVLSSTGTFSFDNTIIILGVIFTELFLSYVFILIISFIPFIVKPIVVIFFVCNSIALYFINSYGIIIDKTMMGNVLNTNTKEALELFSYQIIIYVILLGIIPSIIMVKIKITRKFSFKRFLSFTLIPLFFLTGYFYVNSTTWLWIDKNLKVIASLSMPFSYPINFLRYQLPIWFEDSKEHPLPMGEFINDNKVLVILVIGESARADNFSLYGYDKKTNPKLEKIDNIVVFPDTMSCSTYTTASLKCILSHLGSNVGRKNYEYLPTYLKKHEVNVIWRANNWGEPKISANLFQRRGDIYQTCGEDKTCQENNLDTIMLHNLENIITSSLDNNTFIVLHQSGSHGPAYFTKYPPEFEHFKPVCKSVEIKQNCTQESLINAYDNTILYTDYFLNQVINILKKFPKTPSVMIYISDHGESLGENNVYLHGLPNLIAPDVQRRIPFIAWVSDDFKKKYNVDITKMATNSSYSQDYIFHSVIGAFGLKPDFYNNNLDIFHEK